MGDPVKAFSFDAYQTVELTAIGALMAKILTTFSKQVGIYDRVHEN